ncbi:unnamed protein product [Citrullus colocynthis]|uniref:Uncharacterized protein n=1 Tax=Citrullus colocynthis TaxID=252529 RepID=A0ABP0Y8M6_9ROSI
MKSKAALFVCLLFVSVFVIASAVSEGTEEKVEAENGNPVKESKMRCRYGCCHYYGGDCIKCCGSPTEAARATNQNGDEEGEVEASGFVGGGKGGKGGKKGGKGGRKGK